MKKYDAKKQKLLENRNNQGRRMYLKDTIRALSFSQSGSSGQEANEIYHTRPIFASEGNVDYDGKR